MQINGTRFGTIDYTENELLRFPEGLIGLPQLARFLVIPHKDDSPFSWLQSVDEPSLAFLVSNPWHYFHEYDPEIAPQDAQALGLAGSQQPVLLVTATVPQGNANEMTLNLLAPIVINCEARVGKQVVLESEAYTIKQRVFQTSVEKQPQAA